MADEEPENEDDDEKGPVDYNALDYETMDGGGSDKDDVRVDKNVVSTMLDKVEPEIAPLGNGAADAVALLERENIQC